MILGYKKPIGSNHDAFHYGLVNGKEFKFIRVILGLALPVIDRVQASGVIFGETYRVTGPASWIALGATTGPWPQVESAIAQYRQDLKFTYVIVENEQSRQLIWRMRGLSWGINEVPLVTYAAPFYAGSEIGRSYTDQLIGEGRLNGLKDTDIWKEINHEPGVSYLAISYAMCWLKDHPAIYAPLRPSYRGQGYILGVQGLE